MASAIDRITSNPEICGGRPTIRGLRIRVSDILDMLAGGASRADILRDYPRTRTFRRRLSMPPATAITG